MFGFKKIAMPSKAEALPGRSQPIPTASEHFVNHHGLKGPYPDGSQKAMFGLGCFWAPRKRSGNWATASTSPRSAMPAG